MKERIGESIQEQTLPDVVYEGRLDFPDIPFTIEIDKAKLAQLLTEEFGLSDTEVRNLRFIVTDEMPVRKTELLVSEKGVKAKLAVIEGATHLVKDKKGKKRIEINIHAGTPLFEFLYKKERLLEYVILNKQEDMLPRFRNRIQELEELIIQEFKSKRLPQYLKTVDLPRAIRFLDRFLSRELARGIVKTIIHESSHVQNIEDEERLANQILKNKKLQLASLSLSAGTAIGGLVGSHFVAPEFSFVILAAPVSLGSYYLFFLQNLQDSKRLLKIHEENEDEAKKASKTERVRAWLDLVKLHSNPNYQQDI